jgi:hypothetical protein
MGRILVNHGNEFMVIHRLHYDIILLARTREFDSAPKSLDAVRRVEFPFGKHPRTGKVVRYQLFPCERRTRDYYTVTIAIATGEVTIALKDGEIIHLRQIPIVIKRPIFPNAMRRDLPLKSGSQRGNRG